MASGPGVAGAVGTGSGISPGSSGSACCGGSAFSNPGRKNEAGEMLWLALIPLHPAPNARRAAQATNRQDFQ